MCFCPYKAVATEAPTEDDGAPAPQTQTRANQTGCTCRLRGDPLVETYDGQTIVLLGDYKYTFTKLANATLDECYFNVEVKAGQLNPKFVGMTYARFVDIQIYNLNFRFNQDESVTIAGNPIDLPYSDDNLEISRDGDFVTLTSGCGIEISFNGKGIDSVATVTVPDSFQGKLAGLCGDCDGNLDDHKTKEGMDVSNMDAEGKFIQISESFIVDESSDIASRR